MLQHSSYALEVKLLGETGVIEGLASDPTVDSYNESVAPGAFTASLERMARANRAPVMLYHHDMSRPIGRWMEVREDRDGLHVKGKLTMEASDARDAYALLRDGALTGLSIGFWPKKKHKREDGVLVLDEVDLLEISLVSLPANPNARISEVKAIASARDIAELLQQAGLSGRKAKAAAGAAWRIINESDDEAEAEARALAILEASAARIAAIGRR